MKKLIIFGLLATMGTQAMAQDIIMRRPLPKMAGAVEGGANPDAVSTSCDNPEKSVMIFERQDWSYLPFSEPIPSGQSCVKRANVQCVRTNVYCSSTSMANEYPNPPAGAVLIAAEQILPDSECETFTGNGFGPYSG